MDKVNRGAPRLARLVAAILGFSMVLCSRISAQTITRSNPRIPAELSIALRTAANAFDWSPDGRKLAYTDAEGLLVANAGAVAKAARIFASGGTSDPLWSPEGHSLAFIAPRKDRGSPTIWVTNEDGRSARDVLPLDGSVGVWMLSAWLNPHEIAFEQRCGTGCVELDKVDLQTGKAYIFCVGKGPFYWSPDRSRAIVNNLSSGPNPQGLGMVDSSQLTTVSPNSASSNIRECRSDFEGCAPSGDHPAGPRTADNELYNFDSWAPNSKRALYTGLSCPDVEQGGDLYVWDMATGQRTRVLYDGALGVWSPSGSAIAFLLFGSPQYTETGKLAGGNFIPASKPEIYVGSVAGGATSIGRVIDLCPAKEPWLPIEHPLWSPNSERLIVRDADGNLLLFTADGKKKTMLLEGWKGVVTLAYYMRGEASWSPDGKWISILVQEMHSPDSGPAGDVGRPSGASLGFGGAIGSPGAASAQPTFTQVLYVIANPKL